MGYELDIRSRAVRYSKRWRTGRSVGRTIYAQKGDGPSKADDLVGMMDSPELAILVVTAVNEHSTRAERTGTTSNSAFSGTTTAPIGPLLYTGGPAASGTSATGPPGAQARKKWRDACAGAWVESTAPQLDAVKYLFHALTWEQHPGAPVEKGVLQAAAQIRAWRKSLPIGERGQKQPLPDDDGGPAARDVLWDVLGRVCQAAADPLRAGNCLRSAEAGLKRWYLHGAR